MQINSIINSQLLINSPLEQFEVTSLLGINAPIFGYINLTLTNLALYSILVLFIVLSLHYAGNNDNKLLSSRWSILLESIFASINSMVKEQIGKEIYLPFIYSLFFFILLFVFIYLFLSNSNWENLFKIILSFITSFVVFYFVFNNFKYSNNLFIRFIQKFVLYNICFIFAVSLASYIDFSLFNTIFCDPIEGDINNNNDNNPANQEENKNVNIKFEISMPKDVFKTGLKVVGDVLSNHSVDYGASAAGGAAASAAAKAASGLPLTQRVLVAGGTAVAVSGGVIIGKKVGHAIANNTDIVDIVKNHPYSDPNIDRIPSPDSNFFINSPLEKGEIPLIELLESLILLNILEIILIAILILILFNKKISDFNKKIISNGIKKHMPVKYHHYIKIFDKGVEYNNKFMSIMLVIVIILLLVFVLGNLFVSCELYGKIDEYVLAYNYFKTK